MGQIGFVSIEDGRKTWKNEGKRGKAGKGREGEWVGGAQYVESSQATIRGGGLLFSFFFLWSTDNYCVVKPLML